MDGFFYCFTNMPFWHLARVKEWRCRSFLSDGAFSGRGVAVTLCLRRLCMLKKALFSENEEKKAAAWAICCDVGCL